MNPRPVPPEFAPGQVLSGEELRWLGACGENVRIYRGCRMIPPDRIQIGDSSQVDEGVWIFAGEGVVIGQHVHLAVGSSISGGGTCHIEDYVGIGMGVRLITGTEIVHEGKLTNPTIPEPYRSVRRGRITVGRYAVVFTNSIVFPDVAIGEGAVVSAGSIVHRSLKPWAVYGGNPLVQIGVRDSKSVLQAKESFATARCQPWSCA